MPRTRRFIESRALYEISFRATDSLPLVCTRYMSLVIRSVLARVQRNEKVLLHHYVFEGSHPHLLVTALDAEQCRRFYGEVKKQITEAVKRLTGLKRLSLWEDRASVILVPTLDDAIQKITYLYANPSNDDQEDSIDRYPGVTSWEYFNTALGQLETTLCCTQEVPWVRQPMIPKLPPHNVLFKRQDDFITAKMLNSANKRSHLFKVYPNAWLLSVFTDPTPDDIKDANMRILKALRLREQENRERRIRENKRVVGASSLKSERLLKPHQPKKQGRKIFVHTQDNLLRIDIINTRRHIDARCREVYDRWRLGDFSVPWPPGTFPPPPPIIVNLLCDST